MELNNSDDSEETNLLGLESLMEAVLTMESEERFKEESDKTSETIIIRSSELTNSQKDAFRYLREKKIEQLFRFLIAHTLVRVPEDPISFLVDLLIECIEFRDEDGNPPLLFDQQHQEIIYRGMDPKNTGRITFQQYCIGLRTMGITNYNLRPAMVEEGMVEKEIFLNESDKQLIKHLLNMIEFNVPDVEYEEEILPVRNASVKSTEFTLIDQGGEYLSDGKSGKARQIRESICFSDDMISKEMSSESINEVKNIFERKIQGSSSSSNKDVRSEEIYGTSSGKININKIIESKSSNGSKSSISSGERRDSPNIEKKINERFIFSTEKGIHEMSSENIDVQIGVDGEKSQGRSSDQSKKINFEKKTAKRASFGNKIKYHEISTEESINETKNYDKERKIQKSSSSNISKKLKSDHGTSSRKTNENKRSNNVSKSSITGGGID